MAPQDINWAIYKSLPPEQAQYQLAHIHERRRKSIAVAYAICLSIAFVAVIMRFVSRRIGRSSYGADDWSMVVAMILTAAFAASALLATTRFGGGQHTILMAETDPINFAKSVLASEVLYGPAIGAVKISTLLLFARIFPDRKFKRALWAIGIFLSIYTAILVIAAIFQCRPISGAWDPTIKANCIQIKLVLMSIGGLNVLTDLFLLIAPLPQLWKLHIRNDTKYQLIGIFSIGGFATIVSIYRIPKLNDLSFLDPAWSDCDASIWSIVEICVAILCASAITYRPLFNSLFRIPSFPFGVKNRSSRPSATPLSNKAGGWRWGKASDIAMQPLDQSHQGSASSGRSKARLAENGEKFFRIGDGVDG